MGSPTPTGVPTRPVTPTLELVLRLDVTVDPPVELGQTGRGRRRLVPITGGTARGPALTGTVLPGGNDIQIVHADGFTELTARYGIETHTGAHVLVENHGTRHAAPEVMDRLLAGDVVDPALVYFRTTPRFETDSDALRWLERDQFVASAARLPDRVILDVYRVA